jgi:hypothetical protein
VSFAYKIEEEIALVELQITHLQMLRNQLADFIFSQQEIVQTVSAADRNIKSDQKS